MIKTAQLLALAEAATPGPWNTDSKDHDYPHQDIRIRYGEGRIKRTICTVWIDDACYDENPQQERNARFIAAANPETIKQMCLREQKLVKSNIMLKDALSAIARGCNSSDPASIIARDALEAFNKWEGK